ncbi:MAG: DNA (cytosine-5-)-methyltransferase [candidate division WOR-3 bacterium]
MMKEKQLYFLDLFAGAGGLSEGFLREGFVPVAFVEKDTNACFTLKTRLAYYYLKSKNKIETYNDYLLHKIFREELYDKIPESIVNSVINKTISENTLEDIFKIIDTLKGKKKIDIIIGGPPCQAYSIIGRSRMGNKASRDERNYLYQFYIEFLKKYKPAIFIFENVPGLLSAGNSKYFDEMINCFKKEKYEVQYNILNAADFGVLQNRKRVFFAGYRKDVKFSFPVPEQEASSNFTLKDIFEDLPLIKDGDSLSVVYYTKKANQYLIKSKIRNGVNFTTMHSTRSIRDLDKKIYKIAIEKFLKTGEQLDYNELPEYLKTHKNRNSFTDRFKVLNPDGLSHTIVAHLAKDGHYFIYPDPENPRSISVREAARIQSFPDDYYFEGSRTSMYQQIGNAVPPLMAHKIAIKIKELLK